MNTRKKITNPKIAVITGDGIGKEVMPEGVRALEAAAKKFGISFSLIILISLAAITTNSMAR